MLDREIIEAALNLVQEHLCLPETCSYDFKYYNKPFSHYTLRVYCSRPLIPLFGVWFEATCAFLIIYHRALNYLDNNNVFHYHDPNFQSLLIKDINKLVTAYQEL